VTKTFSTFAIAEMLQVDPGSVANWIDSDILKAHRTPGGHRQVEIDDLLLFLKQHNMPVPTELQGKEVSILVVDDEEEVVSLIVRTIEIRLPQYTVYQACDGFAAGVLITTCKPAVVILDIHMPGLDGFEVCKIIKAKDHTEYAEVIAITGDDSEKVHKRILECGARICLVKPLDMDNLISEIEKSL